MRLVRARTLPLSGPHGTDSLERCIRDLFYVFPKDRVQLLTHNVMESDELLECEHGPAVRDSIRNSVAAHMGRHLMDSGAVRTEQTREPWEGRTVFRFQVLVVMPKKDKPEADE